MADDSGVYQHWWDGAGGVLLLPWAWVPLVLGLLAVLGRGPRRAASLTGQSARGTTGRTVTSGMVASGGRSRTCRIVCATVSGRIHRDES